MAKPKMKKIDLSCAGGRVRKARIDKSLTIDDLSKRIDVSSAYLGMIERGERNPPDQMLTRIAEATGTSIGWLKNGDMDNADDAPKKDDKSPKPDLVQQPLNIDAALFLGLIMREEPSMTEETVATILGIDQDDLKKILDGASEYPFPWESVFTALAQRVKIRGILKKLCDVKSFFERVDTDKTDFELTRAFRECLSEQFQDEFTPFSQYLNQEGYVDIKESYRSTGYPVRRFVFTQKSTAARWTVSLYSELSGPPLEQLIGITKDPEEIHNNENEALVFIEKENFQEALSYAKLIRDSDCLPRVALMLLDPDTMHIECELI